MINIGLHYEYSFFLFWKANLNVSVKTRFEGDMFLKWFACMLEMIQDV